MMTYIQPCQPTRDEQQQQQRRRLSSPARKQEQRRRRDEAELGLRASQPILAVPRRPVQPRPRTLQKVRIDEPLILLRIKGLI